MVLRAEELAAWLRTRPFDGCPSPTTVAGKFFQQHFKRRTGIIFFKDYWLRKGERSPTGDHIDLWNHDRLTPSFHNFLRFSLGISHISNPLTGDNWYSDLENARQVTLWAIA